MIRISIDLAGDEQANPGTLRGIDRDVDTLLRTNPREHQSEIALGAGPEWADRNPVLDRGDEFRIMAAACVLSCRDALQPSIGPGGIQRLARVPIGWQVQRRQHRNSGRRQIGVKIHSVQVHEIETDLAIQALRLCRPSGRVNFADALLWAVARAAAPARVWSFDQRFPADGIELREP